MMHEVSSFDFHCRYYLYARLNRWPDGEMKSIDIGNAMAINQLHIVHAIHIHAIRFSSPPGKIRWRTRYFHSDETAGSTGAQRIFNCILETKIHE